MSDDVRISVSEGTDGRIRVRIETPGAVATGTPSTLLEPAFVDLLRSGDFTGEMDDWSGDQVKWLIRHLDGVDFQQTH